MWRRTRWFLPGYQISGKDSNYVWAISVEGDFFCFFHLV